MLAYGMIAMSCCEVIAQVDLYFDDQNGQYSDNVYNTSPPNNVNADNIVSYIPGVGKSTTMME